MVNSASIPTGKVNRVLTYLAEVKVVHGERATGKWQKYVM